MKTLFLLRHSKSSWKDTLLDDHDRPLNGRGRDEAPLVGEYMRQRGLTPAFVAVSTSRRTLETLAQVLYAIRYEGQVRSSGQLYLAEAADLLEFIRATPEPHPSLLLVAHNPGLEQLVEHLTGQASPMPTSSLVQIQLPVETWCELNPDGSGTLVETWRPATRK